ncbi:MAG TPA: ATP-binding cassette domain-containing protein [Aurantimonas sp.]|jgi:tungstate transport system ATP-binding protein|nr:ATP-binding cassette domain-containing protein [Aurantimonas sp.]
MKALVRTDLPLSLHDVSLVAGGNTILDRVAVTIRAGAPTVIVGPNGAGKSSLLRIAMGLTAPSSGRVTWGGRMDSPPVRRAMLFQRPIMLRRSTLANVIYGLAQANCPRPLRGPRAEALLQRVGLGDHADRPARSLSGGEQQKLALARALARDPELLLLDEPTANLDPAASRAVEAIICEAAASGIKVLMASHDLGQVRRLAGEVLFMAAGRVREHKPVTEFFDNQSTPEAAAFLRGDLVV